LLDYSSAISLNPAYRIAYWQRGFVYELSKNLQSALSNYLSALAETQAYDLGNLTVLNCDVANCELRLLHPDSALKYDSIAMLLSPRYSRAYIIKAQIHVFQKKYVEAINDFTSAIINDQGDNIKRLSAIIAERADAKRMNKQYKEAINDYALALKVDPENKIAYWNRGAAYHAHKDYELAADDYTKAISYYQGDNINLSKLYDDRASNELGQNLLTQAIRDDSVALVLNPDNKSACFDQISIYTQNGDYQLSIDKCQEALSFQKDNKKLNSALYFQIASNEYFLNEFDRVITDCTLAISLNPENSSPYFYRGKVYLKKLNKTELATNDFNKVLELDTSKKTVNYIFSLFYTGKGNEAINILQNELVNTTDNVAVLGDYYNLACLYSMMNKPEEANNYLKTAIDKGYSKKYAGADEDLDNIRNTDDYKTIIGIKTNK
jgi:tetratricopeptide (TPR) repeat protein